MRQGNHSYSMPFGIGQKHTSAQVSARFRNDKVEVTPVLVEFDLTQSDPTGSRHLTTDPGFIGILASGVGTPNIATSEMDFRSTDIGAGSGVSCTKAAIFRIADFNCPSSRVHNVRLWASDTSDFLNPTDIKILFSGSSSWNQSFEFKEDDFSDTSLHLSSTLPTEQNIFRQDGGRSFYESGDTHVSQFLHLALAASGTASLGGYGVPSSGLRFRFSYNIDNFLGFRD